MTNSSDDDLLMQALPALSKKLLEHKSDLIGADWRATLTLLIRTGKRPMHTAHKVITKLMDAYPNDPLSEPGRRKSTDPTEATYSDMLYFVRDLAMTYSFRDNEHAERIVAGVALRGMYNHLEETAQKLLSRRPSAEEVLTLAKACCADGFPRGCEVEKKLRLLLRRRDPATEAHVNSLIEKAIEKERNHIDF